MRATSEIASFHAHVYFGDEDEAATAKALREAIAARFAVRLGTWWDRPVGPHAAPMYQIAFAPELFAAIVPFLMLNHGPLSILVHPNSGRPRADHVEAGLWLGPALALDERVLPEREDAPEGPGEINTAPTPTPQD
jgi:aromatic ring-cleaving dioxygenase